MGSFSPACEIVEVNDEQMHQIIKLGSNKSLEDDISKIFEAISLKVSSKDQMLNHSVSSPISKHALKKSFRSGFPNSPDLRPSEAVSLKHALRRQCISQASEMAAIKRISSPICSPRISESGRITSLYKSVILEADTLSETKPKSGEKQVATDKNKKNKSESVPVQNLSISKTVSKEKKHFSISSGDIVPGLPPKPRQKGNLQQKAISSSTLIKTSKGSSRPTRKVSRMVRPVSTNRPIIKKDLNPEMIATSPTPNKGELLCQRCQCALANQKKEDAEDLGLEDHKKVNENAKIEKGDEDEVHDNNREEEEEESNTSRSMSSSGRPHMSKNIKWEAIKHVINLRGGLGLKHFNLLKKLGSGDIGTVYLAELIGTNCLFAIKVVDNDYLERRKKMPRAISERDILKMLDHPFLPTLYAEFVSDNLSCLVMEYCPGGDLHVLRQKQPGRYFPEASARFYAAEVLLALEYLHVLGVIYRDLKPENILVSEDGHIMLTDFDLSLRCEVNPTLLQFPSSYREPPRISGPCTGSNCIDPFCIRPSCEVSCLRPWLLPKSNKVKNDSKPLPQLVAEPTDARSNSFVGTHEYLAPEIIKGDGHGSAVDWWTFGILIYELLYGRTPFKGSGNDETLANVVLESLEFPESPMVSLHARDLIRELLVKEPENRLGYERGAAELKKHPFFDGLNWALIRCAIPPQLPELYNLGVMNLMTSQEGNPEFEFF